MTNTPEGQFGVSTPEEVARGKTNMLVGDDRGHVFVRFPQPMTFLLMEPENAFHIAEAIARAAHKARFGTDAPTDRSYIAEQVRLRVTEEMRDRKITRVAVLVENAKRGGKTTGYWAMQIVDAILSDIA